MRTLTLCLLTALTVTPSAARACFMRSPQPVQVWMDHIHVEITDQVAVKTYHCVFKNPNGQAIVGGTCYMELEPGSQVDDMSVTVNGHEARAEILGVEKANEVFAQIVQEGGSPALLEYYGNQLIRTQVPKVAAGETITVKLQYTTVLKKQGDVVRLQMLNTNPKALMQPLKSVGVTVHIKSREAIKNLYSPTHEIAIEETPGWDVTATWKQDEYLPSHPFVLYYQTGGEQVAASVLTHRELGEDGTFLLMLSPTVGRHADYDGEAEDVLPKDVVFCVDTSGSMLEDNKMEQARAALAYCVNHLRPGDRFNIVDFGTAVRSLAERGLVDFDDSTAARAARYIEDLAPRGGTAIDDALKQSLTHLGEAADRAGRLQMIVFATDGLPTIGEREPAKILERVAKLNTDGVRIFVFGEGYNVNTKLLDFLALNHRGESEYVLPKENIERKIGRFFDRVGSPLLTDLKLEFEGIEVKDVFPRSVKDVYRGEQIIVYGRYAGHGSKTVRLSGRGANGMRKTFEFELEFPEISTDDRHAFVPRLWAGQKVDFLLNEIRRRDDEPAELIEEVTFLAKRYGIVTPYTSFLLVEENVNAPQTAQVENFKDRLHNEVGGLRLEASGEKAVTNTKRQAEARWELARNGNAANFYKQVQFACDKEGRGVQAQAALRYVGARCFYNSQEVWYDSRFDETKRAQVQNVEIGSAEYLSLLADNPDAAKFMAQGEVVLELKGNWYQFTSRKRS
jgi:Ca-activated chloride channel family protein